MAKQYNASANFTNIDNTEFDSGLKMTNTAERVYLLEEASGMVMNDLGTDGQDGVRDVDLTRVTGAATGRYATKGDGTNYNTIPWSSDFRNNFTWQMWIKPTAADLAGGFVDIFGSQEGSTGRFTYLAVESDDLYVVFSTNGSTNTRVLVATAEIIADTWYHVRFGYGSSGCFLSIDGVEKDTDTSAGILFDLSAELRVFHAYNVTKFQGAIADIRFYNSVLSSTYTTPTDYYNGTSLIHDSGVLYSDSGLGLAFDNSTATETATDLTLEYQYADYESPQAWSTASDVNDNAAWNGSWLTLAQLQAETDPTTRTYRYLKTRIAGAGSLTEFSIDLYALDITAPSDVSALANAAFSGESDTYDLMATFTGGTDTGGSGYAGANLEIEEGGVSYFQQSDGSFLADETFDNLLLKGDADTRDIIYALGRSAVPTRFRINSWDNAENYNRGEWSTFLKSSADNVLKSAGGNYNDDNLIPENVKNLIEFGIDETGTYDPTGTTPDTPILGLTNNEDGTLTIQVSGSSTGSSNKVYTLRYGDSAWTLQDTISEDGSILVTGLTGVYWVYCESTVGSSAALTEPKAILVTAENIDVTVLAQYVADYLNSIALSQSFIAQRETFVREDLHNVRTLTIYAIPYSRSASLTTRTAEFQDDAINIAIVKKGITEEDVETMNGFVTEVINALRMVHMLPYKYLGHQNAPLFSAELLKTKNLYQSVITFNYKNLVKGA